MIIETKRLRLVAGDREMLTSAIQGNTVLSEKLGAEVPENWTEFGTVALQYSLDRMREKDEEKNWWTYFPIHKIDNVLIGSGGYKGSPGADGTVEIGYEIAPSYRDHGLATEMAGALVAHAFKDERVKAVIAHTLGGINPSTGVLKKCGFRKTIEINDPDDGLIWQWEIKKPG